MLDALERLNKFNARVEAEGMSEMSIFTRLNAVNVNEHTEKKNGLTYLSWAWAWAEVKKMFPDATYSIYERNGEYGPVNYFTDGKTCWVKTGVTINGLEHIEELPVMDFKNRSIPFDAINSMDVNKAIQRSLTKACARHGLGLYIYAGEDLPEGEEAPRPEDEVPETRIPAEPFSAAKAIQNFCKRHNITMQQFGQFRNGLVASNVVEDKKGAEMTLKDCSDLFKAILDNYKDAVKVYE